MRSVPRRLALVVALAAIVAFPATAVANHSWNGYHWARQANPFVLKVGDNLSSSWKGYLKTAASDWSKSTVLDMTVVAGGSSNKQCRPTAGRDEVCNGAYGFNGWLGIAQVWVSGKHITQGTTKVNDTYFNTSTYNSSAWRQLVMCQEVGHTIGLYHQDEKFSNANLGTCMDYTNDPDGGAGGASSSDPGNLHPNKHDYDELVAIYKHLDSTTTVGSAVASVADARWNAEWGREVARSAGGHVSTYVRDLGGENLVFTFVIWA